MDREMNEARAIQRALLPEKLPEVEGYRFYLSYDPAGAVGGDWNALVEMVQKK